MLIYNLINNSTKKNGKNHFKRFAHIKKVVPLHRF